MKPTILFIEKSALMSSYAHIIAYTTTTYFTHSFLDLMHFIDFIKLSSIFIIPGKIEWQHLTILFNDRNHIDITLI